MGLAPSARVMLADCVDTTVLVIFDKGERYMIQNVSYKPDVSEDLIPSQRP